MLFQLDEHLPSAIADGVREKGIDIVTATEAGVRGEPDLIVLARAHAAQRVIVTFDFHYIRFHHAGHPHSGILYCTRKTRSIGQIIDWIETIHGASTPGEMSGHLIFL